MKLAVVVAVPDAGALVGVVDMWMMMLERGLGVFGAAPEIPRCRLFAFGLGQSRSMDSSGRWRKSPLPLRPAFVHLYGS